jgi:glycosyltransferase involved in cell wall biosynthesis
LHLAHRELPAFGTREQVKEGVNALLYEPGDVATLAAHLTRLADDPELRTTFANNSTVVLSSLTNYPEMIRRYGRIFREARFSKGTPWRPPMREG